MLLPWLAVAGATGTVARGAIDAHTITRGERALAVGTLAINVTGGFVLGIFTGLALYHGLATDLRTIVGTGFCGGFTTFSGFAYQSVKLERRDATRIVLATFVLPAAAAALGLALTAW